MVRIRRQTGYVGYLSKVPVTVSGQTKKMRSGEVHDFDVAQRPIEVSASMDWATSCWTVSAHHGANIDLELRPSGDLSNAVGRFELKAASKAVHVERIDPKERQFAADDIGSKLSSLALLMVVALLLYIGGITKFGMDGEAPIWWYAAALILTCVILLTFLRLTVHLKRFRN